MDSLDKFLIIFLILACSALSVIMSWDLNNKKIKELEAKYNTIQLKLQSTISTPTTISDSLWLLDSSDSAIIVYQGKTQKVITSFYSKVK